MADIRVQKINETFIRVTSDENVEHEIYNFFSFEVPGAKYQPKVRKKLWDGIIRLYHSRNKTLYIGLLPYVKEFAKNNNHNIFIPDNLKPTSDIKFDEVKDFMDGLGIYKNGKPIEIRDYQYAAVYKAVYLKRTVILSPPATGKSLMIYGIIRWLMEKGHKTLIVVPSTALVEQLWKDFKEYSENNGFKVDAHIQKLYSGFPKEFKKDVLISTWQSIYKQPRLWFQQFEACVGDEAHMYKSKSLVDIMEKLSTTEYKIGTTGTIDDKKLHRLVLQGLFGIINRVTTNKESMDKKHITKLNVTGLYLKYPDNIREILAASQSKKRKINYQNEVRLITEYKPRNRYITNLACGLEGNTLVLINFIDRHGKPLYDMICKKIKKNNIKKNVYFIAGEVDVKIREDIRERVQKKRNNIIVASYGTFSVGVNVPSIENIVMAHPFKSEIRILQTIGRGLRLEDKKDRCHVFDLIDDISIGKYYNYTLRHAAARQKIYAREKFKTRTIEVDLG